MALLYVILIANGRKSFFLLMGTFFLLTESLFLLKGPIFLLTESLFLLKGPFFLLTGQKKIKKT